MDVNVVAGYRMRNLLFEDDWFSINHSNKAEGFPEIVVCSVTVLVMLTSGAPSPSTR
jgi:hypothetical protein